MSHLSFGIEISKLKSPMTLIDTLYRPLVNGIDMLVYAAQNDANPRQWQVHVLCFDMAQNTLISLRWNGGPIRHRAPCFAAFCRSGDMAPPFCCLDIGSCQCDCRLLSSLDIGEPISKRPQRKRLSFVTEKR